MRTKATMRTMEIPPHLGEMLEKIFEQRAAQEAEPETGRGAPMEQAVYLHDVFTRYNTPRAKLVPGDIVQFKPGMGVIKDEMREGIVMMVWRHLTPVSAGDAAFAAQWVKKLAGGASSCVDMDVVHLCDDGDCLVHMGVDSRELELRTISGEPDEQEAELPPADPATALAADELVS